jgi:hypothetical protein
MARANAAQRKRVIRVFNTFSIPGCGSVQDSGFSFRSLQNKLRQRLLDADDIRAALELALDGVA